MRKLNLLLVIGLMIAVIVTFFPSVAHARAVTNSEVAQLIAKVLELDIPAGSENLPEAEYFEVTANVLAANGIDAFVGAEANTVVTPEGFVRILYGIVGGPEGATADAMLRFLVDIYHMPPFDLKTPLTLAKVTDILNNPAFTPLVAEAYSAREALERGGAEAPGFKLEETPGGSTVPTATNI